jgi:uncharacterized protein YPO0396
MVKRGFGAASLLADTHDGSGDRDGRFVSQPYVKKLKLRKGTHLLGTWKRSYEQLPSEKQKILDEVNQIAQDIKAAQAQATVKDYLTVQNLSNSDYLLQQLEKFEELRNQLRNIENAIELQRIQSSKLAEISEQERQKYQFLLDEENQVMALHFAIAEKIKKMNEEEQEALAIIMSHD